MVPQFFYFDLGRVLVDFEVPRMLGQIAAVSGADVESVKRAVFDEGLQDRYETGKITSREYFDAFCRSTGTNADYEAVAAASSDIFEIRSTMLPLVSLLNQAGHRMGILSNTCENHWQHCLRRFTILADFFPVHALSYRIGVAKPNPAIYAAAVKMAGCRPEETFFVDDLPANVEGARAAGLDAVLYTDATSLATELRKRGVRFNY